MASAQPQLCRWTAFSTAQSGTIQGISTGRRYRAVQGSAGQGGTAQSISTGRQYRVTVHVSSTGHGGTRQYRAVHGSAGQGSAGQCKTVLHWAAQDSSAQGNNGTWQQYRAARAVAQYSGTAAHDSAVQGRAVHGGELSRWAYSAPHGAHSGVASAQGRLVGFGGGTRWGHTVASAMAHGAHGGRTGARGGVDWCDGGTRWGHTAVMEMTHGLLGGRTGAQGGLARVQDEGVLMIRGLANAQGGLVGVDEGTRWEHTAASVMAHGARPFYSTIV